MHGHAIRKYMEETEMKSLVYVDACIRGAESRTRRIAEPLIEKKIQEGLALVEAW